MQLDSFEAVEPVFKLASKHLAEVLSAFEFMDGHSMRLALKHVHGAINPFQDVSNMYVLVETAGMLSTFCAHYSMLSTKACTVFVSRSHRISACALGRTIHTVSCCLVHPPPCAAPWKPFHSYSESLHVLL